MKALFDEVSATCSKITTKAYSTSFSMGIYCLDKKFRKPIYNIYGFVRFADEIVDTFHEYDKKYLLADFKRQTYEALSSGISLNPIINSFQETVKQYNIESELIEAFLHSMEMDLYRNEHDTGTFHEYIYGSAEVVGLMCLRVFTEGDEMAYRQLKKSARSLGSAFQKVNFLRDMNADYHQLGRTYFPEIDMKEFTEASKKQIERNIEKDFKEALEGIKLLPKGSRLGVYLAYVYYVSVFKRIRSTTSMKLMRERIRISNQKKIGLLLQSYIKHSFNLL